MNQSRDNLRSIRKLLRVTQILLLVILVATVWASAQIELWQKVLITLLAIFLVAGSYLKNRLKAGKRRSD